LISHFIRPFTLALRLFANMQGHEIVLIIITLLVPSLPHYQSCSWGFL